MQRALAHRDTARQPQHVLLTRSAQTRLANMRRGHTGHARSRKPREGASLLLLRDSESSLSSLARSRTALPLAEPPQLRTRAMLTGSGVSPDASSIFRGACHWLGENLTHTSGDRTRSRARASGERQSRRRWARGSPVRKYTSIPQARLRCHRGDASLHACRDCRLCARGLHA